LATAMIFAVSSVANAADIKLVRNTAGEPIISLAGAIAPGDATNVDIMLASQAVAGIRLNSPGGNIYEAVRISDLIAAARVPTIVMQGASCASACFMVFVCSPERHAHISSRIGVHGAIDNTAGPTQGQETPSSLVTDVAMARVAAKCGAPASVVAAIVTVPATSGMYWLSTADLIAMGVHLWANGQECASRICSQLTAGR
jgi:hypothetical protein